VGGLSEGVDGGHVVTEVILREGGGGRGRNWSRGQGGGQKAKCQVETQVGVSYGGTGCRRSRAKAVRSLYAWCMHTVERANGASIFIADKGSPITSSLLA